MGTDSGRIRSFDSPPFLLHHTLFLFHYSTPPPVPLLEPNWEDGKIPTHKRERESQKPSIGPWSVVLGWRFFIFIFISIL